MIHGIYHFGRKRVACRNDYCTVCEAPTFAEGRRSLVMLHIIFVPLIPLGLRTRWFCTVCRRETDSKRPSRKGILVAGVLAGFFFMFIGAMMATQEKEPSGWLVVGIGAILTGALLFQIKSTNQSAYETARRRIVPLSGEFCPYCRNPLLAGTTSRCHACNVKIVTD